MMVTNRTVLFFTQLLLLFACTGTHAQNVIYHKEDSLFIERLLEREKAKDTGTAILAIAREFVNSNTVYTGGTLDTFPGEPLFVSCTDIDCTTFVELTIAIAVTTYELQPGFEAACRNLERIRYRNGRRNGYASRLHYISWWIADSAKHELIEEITTAQHCATQRLNLKFMSSNPSKYPQLANSRQTTERIAEYEKPYRGIGVKYIPKNMLNRAPRSLGIKDGDILSIVTAIDGLDVTHVGFAAWKEERLHLVHASSAYGKVVNDTVTLYDYMKNRKNHLGVRVFRMKEQPCKKSNNNKNL